MKEVPTGVYRVRLRDAMKRRGVSQRRLEELTGYYRQSISSYLRGESLPDVGRAGNIAKVLGTSVDWMIGITDTDVRPPAKWLPAGEKTVIFLDRARQQLEEQGKPHSTIYYHVCSHCNGTLETEEGYPDPDGWALPDYCPWCGARMKKERGK